MPGIQTGPVCTEAGRKFLRLQMTEQVGPIRLRGLLTHFGSADAILAASQAELQRVENIGPTTAKAIFKSRSDFGPVDEEIQNAADYGARIVCLGDPDYPAALKHIADPPICLYVRGTLQPTDAVSVGIVGTRRCSHYGREQATRFAEMLARAGFTVVSGLARGVDGYAHRGALRGGGRTLAILGNGLSTIYPPEHDELSEEIIANGALISELPVDAPPEAKNFPGRNRIIAGLCLGILVIEAGKRSGALITARLANEYNREAFALPGNVDRGDWTAGTNALIREGAAKLVTCLEDILDELGDVGRIMTPATFDQSDPSPAIHGGLRARDDSQHECASAARASQTGVAASAEDRSVRPGPGRPAPAGPALTAGQKQVLDAIAAGADHPDSVCESTGLHAGAVAAAITHLQLAGLVARLPGNCLQLRTPAAAPAGR